MEIFMSPYNGGLKFFVVEADERRPGLSESLALPMDTGRIFACAPIPDRMFMQ
ncbi:hypothetical protein [Rhizobium quercicola]|uniref:hypothetical protein n=1 Tax=Rhizobium quercicola TaxID=2901226 RepID=UPI001E49D029|nr:hypothetical protein [Rhizobium quercicola]